jgi:hypothetical protein
MKAVERYIWFLPEIVLRGSKVLAWTARSRWQRLAVGSSTPLVIARFMRATQFA